MMRAGVAILGLAGGCRRRAAQPDVLAGLVPLHPFWGAIAIGHKGIDEVGGDPFSQKKHPPTVDPELAHL